MRSVRGFFLVPWAGSLLLAQPSPPPGPAPFYVESSIVNAANYKADPGLAPNTIATLYGKDLAYVTRAITNEDIRGNILPTTLAGTGVKLLVARIAAPVLFVSPGQVNFVVPPNLLPGPVEVQLGLDSHFGPAVQVRLAEVSPALFPLDPEFAIATRADGSVITRDTPARGGEVIVLYATGLGYTQPRVPLGQIVRQAAAIERIRDLRVRLNGVELPQESVLYAGVTPGFAGLYQINLALPPAVGPNPEIRVGFGDVMSPADVHLPVE